MRASRLILVLLVALCLHGGGAPVRAQDDGLEYKVKAAFLLNFARFITWPEQHWPADQPFFLLTVLGQDPFGSALSGVEEKQIAGRPIHLRFEQTLSGEASAGQMIFVSGSEKAHLGHILASTAGKPIVLVSDIEGFAAAGGMFELKSVNGRLSFIINNSRAREQGLRINASLLKLAIEVL